MEKLISLFTSRSFSRRERVVSAIEMRAWGLLAVGGGAINGGVIGVIIQNKFALQSHPALAVIALALVTGAMPISNLTSTFWVNASWGKKKIIFLKRVLLVFVALISAIFFLPVGNFGLLGMVLLAVGCHVCSSCMITIRALAWRANYTPEHRAKIAASNLALLSAVMAVSGFITGFLANSDGEAYRLVFIVSAGCSLAAIHILSRLHLRHEGQIISMEQSSPRRRILSTHAWKIFKQDRRYRDYLLCMFAQGSGNLMCVPLLILVLSEQLDQSPFVQVILSSSVPLLCVTLTVRLWANVIGSTHIVNFRAYHSWLMVLSMLVIAMGTIDFEMNFVWLGSIMFGITLAGGRLAWHLGHNDFSSKYDSSDYMALHVTLTGIRGLIMPMVGIAFYQFLENNNPGYGRFVLLLPLAFITIGAAGFVFINRRAYVYD
jgi:MFS family permease